MSGSVVAATVNALANNPRQVQGPFDFANKLLEYRRNQLELQKTQSEEALGQAYQGALRPDGTLDTNRLGQLIAQDPRTAFSARTGVESQQKLTGQQIEQAQAHLGVIGQGAASLMTDASDANVNAVFDNMGNLPGADAERQRVLAMTPDQRKAYAYQHGVGALGALDRLNRFTGVGEVTQTPQGMVPYVRQPPEAGGSVTPAPGGVPFGLSPGQLATTVEIKDDQQYLPDGSPNPNFGATKPITLGELLQRRGVQIGATPPGAGAPSPTATPNTGGQGQPATPSPTNQPRLRPPAPAQQQPPSEPVTQLPPGTTAPLEQASKQYADDNQAAGSYQQRIFPLVQAQALLGSGDITTGPGAEAINRVKEFLATRAATFGWDAQTIQQAKFDELNKYLTQYVNSQSMAAGSDARLASALTGNPSAHISTLANKDVVKALIGLERMKQTAITDFNNQRLPPGQYSNFLRNWQNTHDPRAFIFDMMSDEQRQKMVAAMTDTQRKAFARTLTLVEDNPDIMSQAAMPH